MLGITDYLWRLLPGNPILLRVVETGGKRRRDLFIRCGYLGLLILLVLLSVFKSDASTASLSGLTKTSAEVFQNLSYLQLGLVALLAPVFTAGAITQEKDSQTYDILLCTPLSNGQIVLGSLLSRLFFVVTLLVSGIPIFSITQNFGGVLIRNIIVSFLIAAATAFVTGAMAMAIATFKVGTRRTIFSFYMLIVVYLVGVALLDRMPYFHPIIGYDQDPTNAARQVPVLAKTSWLTGLHPFLALRTLFFDQSYLPPELGTLPADLQRWPTGWYLSSPSSFYISAMFSLSLLLVLPSIVLLRWVAQTNLPVKTWLLTKLHVAKGDRTRKPRTVWSNPIAWREAKTKASAARATLLRYTFILGGMAAAIYLVDRFATVEQPANYITTSSYDATAGTLTVYGKIDARHYSVPKNVSITVKDPVGTGSGGSPNNGRAGSLDDLRHAYGAVVDVNPDTNTLAAITLAPPVHKLDEKDARNYLLGLCVLEFSVVLLVITNAAASTVTREKEDGTLDLLLTTPITSRYYIWGKLRGLVYFVLPLLAVPAASVTVFVLYDLYRFGLSGTDDGGVARWIAFPEAILLMPAMLIIVTAFAGILGMHMSLRLRTTVLAVMSSVGIVVGICGLLGWCGYTVLNMHDSGGVALFVGSFSPFTLLTMLVNPYDFADNAFRNDNDLGGNRATIFISAAVAVGIYTAVVWAMYKSMVKNFDMTIRRQQR
jgi:ABC-type transport system involved in multi-copper enzyme maturation permease subunit